MERVWTRCKFKRKKDLSCSYRKHCKYWKDCYDEGVRHFNYDHYAFEEGLMFPYCRHAPFCTPPEHVIGESNGI